MRAESAQFDSGVVDHGGVRRPPNGLHEQVANLLAERGEGIVLERVARGAGRTRWWSCASYDEFLTVYDQLTPGSRVLIYWGDALHLARLNGDEEDRIWSSAAESGEVLFGPLLLGTTEYDIVFLDGAELEAEFARVPHGHRVLWGQQPATETGPDGITFTSPDGDGGVRPQPV
jgi:hypothetical protein